MLVDRVAARFRLSKAMSFVPEFKAALHVFETTSEVEPMVKTIQRVVDFILPMFYVTDGGERPAWFHALGTAKRNTLQWLLKEGRVLLMDLPSVGRDLVTPENSSSRFHKFPEPTQQATLWKQSYLHRLVEWGKKLRTLEIASAGGDEDRIIERGGFTIMPMPGLKKSEVDGALEALDEAASKIRPKFPQVLYGKVFFSTHLSSKTAAHYVYADDAVHLSVRARKRFNDIYTLIHEFGHRFDHKFLKDPLRSQFWNLSTQRVFEKVVYDEKLRSDVAKEAVEIAKARKEKKPFLGMSPELERWVAYPMNARYVKDLMSDFLHGHLDEARLYEEIKGRHDVTIETDKLLHGPLSVTPYGATKPIENFAEAFAHYVLGMAMPEPLGAILAQLG
jgi:hypothetical protein